MIIKPIDDRLTQSMLMPFHPGDAGIDLRACIHNVEKILPNEIKKIPVGIKTAIPKGWVGLIFPRSGEGSNGMHLANVVGVIDPTYRGQVFVKIKNRSDDESRMMVINPMDRIAQLVVVPHFDYETIVFTTGELDDTVRGSSGFGDSGKQ